MNCLGFFRCSVYLVFTFGLSGLGCRSNHRLTKSQLLHQANATFPKGTRIHWRSVTTEEFQKYVLLPSHGAALAFDSVETLGLQALVNAIDQGQRALRPEELAHIPIPRVAVINNREANAFVATVPLCFNNKVKLSPSLAPNTTRPAIAAVTLDRNAHWQPNSKQKCLPILDSAEFLAAIIEEFNQSHASCRMSLNNGVLNLGFCDPWISNKASPAGLSNLMAAQ